MALPINMNIDSLTYTHDDLRSKWFHLDRLLDRMSPFFSIDEDSNPPIKELGTLTIFPAELLLDIFEHLSIRDLMRFRRCNRFSAYFVNSIPPLRKVLRIAPNTVKGLVALQVSTHITAKQLCQKIHQRECDRCGELAQSIYLPTFMRVCFACLHPDRPRYLKDPKTEEDLRLEIYLDSEEIPDRPNFRPLLCTFTNGMNKFKTVERHILYDDPLESLDSQLGWDASSKDRYHTSNSVIELERFVRAVRMMGQDPERDAVTVVHDPLHFLLRKHMAAVIAPWPDTAALKAEQGVFCSTCLGTERQDRLYTRDTFLEHLKDCRVGPESFWYKASRSKQVWLCDDNEEGEE